jgi:bacterioferritin-associated ferredoxin
VLFSLITTIDVDSTAHAGEKIDEAIWKRICAEDQMERVTPAAADCGSIRVVGACVRVWLEVARGGGLGSRISIARLGCS